MCLYVSGFLQRPEEDTGSPGAGVTGGCESPCGCQQLNEGLGKSGTDSLTTKYLSSPRLLSYVPPVRT